MIFVYEFVSVYHNVPSITGLVTVLSTHHTNGTNPSATTDRTKKKKKKNHLPPKNKNGLVWWSEGGVIQVFLLDSHDVLELMLYTKELYPAWNPFKSEIQSSSPVPLILYLLWIKLFVSCYLKICRFVPAGCFTKLNQAFTGSGMCRVARMKYDHHLGNRNISNV